MSYQEQPEKCVPYQKAYLEGIEGLISRWEAEAQPNRDELAKRILAQPDEQRARFCQMLGRPLAEKRPEPPVPTTEVLSEVRREQVIRMHFEILDGVVMSGIYLRHAGNRPRPLVICQHGGLGTPEMICGFDDGQTYNYNDMAMRTYSQGVDVFAPQLLLWNEEKQNLPHNRREIDARLKRVGSSVTAVEIYGIQRIMDYFETKPEIDKFGMVGLSYGGFYALLTAAVDTRIISTVSCGYFNERKSYPWTDWTWENEAFNYDDAEIACLIYPRQLSIRVGNKDEIFDVEGAEREYARLCKLCETVGTDWLDFVAFDGTHEFPKEM